MRTYQYIYIFISCLFLTSCYEENITEENPAPFIELLGFSPNESITNAFNEEQQAFSFLIKFSDEQGDIGIIYENINETERNLIIEMYDQNGKIDESDGGNYSMIFFDEATTPNSLNSEGGYQLYKFSPFSGEIAAIFQFPYNGYKNYVSPYYFQIYLLDRENNKSNVITTPSFEITE